MPTVFPGAIDALTNPLPGDPLPIPVHSAQHATVNDAIEAVEGVLVGPLVYNVKGYGAVGDGVANDTAAIQSAITAAAATGGIVTGGGDTYKVTATLSLSSNVTLQDMKLDGSSIGIADNILEAVGSIGSSTALTANAAEGALSVTVASSAGLTVNDWVQISSGAVFGTTNQPKGEIARIESVAGTTVTLYDPLADSYATADTAILRKLTFMENVTLNRVGVIGPTNTGLSVVGLHAEYVRNLSVSDSTFRRTHWFGVAVRDSVGVSVVGCNFAKIEGAGLAYGVGLLFATQDATVSACTGQRLRPLVTVGGGSGRPGVPRRVTVTGCVVSQSMASAFNAHPAGEDISFVGNIVYGSDDDGIVFQAASGVVQGNIVRGCADDGILIQPLTIKPTSIIVDGNRIHDSGGQGIIVLTSASAPSHQGVVISNNLVEKAGTSGIEVEANAAPLTGLTVSGNIVRDTGTHPITIRACDHATITGNIIECSSASTSGIRLFTVTRSTISGNSFRYTNATSTRCINLTPGDDCTIVGNTGTGAGIGILFDSASDNNTVVGNNMRGNTTPYSLSTGTNNVVANNIGGLVASVASGATIALPASENSVYNITGTTGITSITALDAGRVVTLKFVGILTVTDGGNLRLNGNFVTSADDTLTLFCDGTNWYEIARSAN